MNELCLLRTRYFYIYPAFVRAFFLHFWRCCRSPTSSGLAPLARALRFASPLSLSLLFLFLSSSSLLSPAYLLPLLTTSISSISHSLLLYLHP